MNIYFYSPLAIEPWDWRNTVDIGIGGSETSHVELAWRLARRGHNVISYTVTPPDCPRHWRGVEWKHIDEADFSQEGIWIIYRTLDPIKNFKPKKKNQIIWVISQDVDCSGWNDELAENIDHLFALCKTHLDYLVTKHPKMGNKIVVFSNGVKVDEIREIERKGVPERNPKRLMYASSPDRGLIELLKIFRRAREYDNELELHVYYGFDNIDKLLERYKGKTGGRNWEKTKVDFEKEIKQPGVFYHGRIGQKQLYREWFKAGIWCYPTEFEESSCISCMEAQAMGAIPITNPYWALKDNVQYGIFIPGKPKSDALVRARYVNAIVRVANNPEMQEKLRHTNMSNIRYSFNWSLMTDRLDQAIWVFENPNKVPKSQFLFRSQAAFQHKYSKGKILNVGCQVDLTKFHERGAVNVDIMDHDPITGMEFPVDIIADARKLPETLHNKFDTVILGDILEHMNDEDIEKTVACAKKCLRKNGDIVITCPNDVRPFKEQFQVAEMITGTPVTMTEYTNGVKSYHSRKIGKDFFENIAKKFGFKIKIIQEIDYTFSNGYGVSLCLDENQSEQ